MTKAVKVYFNEHQQNATETLEDLKKMDFETLIVVGITKDAVHLRTSSCESTLQLLGALEAVKDHILNTWG